MIQRDHFEGPISFACDKCSEVDETHCNNFGGALAKAKSHGWTVKKSGDEWEHFCPEHSQ